MTLEEERYFSQYPEFKMKGEPLDWQNVLDYYGRQENWGSTDLHLQEYGPYKGYNIAPQFATGEQGQPLYPEYSQIIPGKFPASTPKETGASSIYGWGPDRMAQLAAIRMIESDNPVRVLDMAYGDGGESSTMASYWPSGNVMGINVDLQKDKSWGEYFDLVDSYGQAAIDAAGITPDSLYEKMIMGSLRHEGGGHLMEKEYNLNIPGLSEGKAINPAWLANYDPDIFYGSPEYKQILEQGEKGKGPLWPPLKNEGILGHTKRGGVGLLKNIPFFNRYASTPNVENKYETRHWPIYAMGAQYDPYDDFARAGDIFPLDEQQAVDLKAMQNYAKGEVQRYFTKTGAEETQQQYEQAAFGGPRGEQRATQVGPPGRNYNTGGIASLW